MLEEDIAPVLARLEAWYAAHLAPDKFVFNPPATDGQLDAFEQLVGFKMPRSYRQLYDGVMARTTTVGAISTDSRFCR